MRLEVSGLPSRPLSLFTFFMQEFPSQLSPYFSTIEDIFVFMVKETNFEVDAINGQIVLLVAPKGRNVKERVPLQMAREMEQPEQADEMSN